MKGKRIVGIVSAAVAAVMCVGLVGCGGNSVNAKKVKGSQVTKEQFESATVKMLESENLTAEYSVVGSMDTELDFSYVGGKRANGKCANESIGKVTRNGGKESSVYTEKIDFSGDMKFIADYMDYSVKETEDKDEEEQEEYYDSETGNIYTKNADDEWEADPAYAYRGLVAAQANNIFSMLNYTVPELVFENYEYDEKETGYVPKRLDDYNDKENSLEFVIKFNQEGKLSAIYLKSTHTEYRVDGGSYPVAITEKTELVINVIVTYGDAEAITLPTVKKES